MRWSLGISILVLAGAAYFLFDLFQHAGAFRTVEAVAPGPCRAVEGLIGSEDLDIDPATGFVFVSSLDWRKRNAGQQERGSILALDLNSVEAGFRNLTPPSDPAAPSEFFPHGISLETAGDGSLALAVINHRSDKSVVEIFRVEMDAAEGGTPAPRLIHQRTVESADFRNPNDVVLAGGGFYVTNDHWYEAGLMNTVETLLRLNFTNIVYFDGLETRIVAEGLSYANGIAKSPDNRRIYAAESTDGTVRVFDRDLASGALTPAGDNPVINLGTGVDNIDVMADGSLIIGAHPKLFAFSAHAADAKNKSPSEVVKVQFSEHGARSKTIWADSGDVLSGSTVGAIHEDRLVIGTVFEPKILVCEIGG